MSMTVNFNDYSKWYNSWIITLDSNQLYWNLSYLGTPAEANYESILEYILDGGELTGPIDGESQPSLLAIQNPIEAFNTPKEVYNNIIQKFGRINISFTNTNTKVKKNVDRVRTDFTHIDPKIEKIDDNIFQTTIGTNTDSNPFFTLGRDGKIANEKMYLSLQEKFGHRLEDTYKYPDQITLSIAPITFKASAALYFYFESSCVINLIVTSKCKEENTTPHGFGGNIFCSFSIPLFEKTLPDGRELKDALLPIGGISSYFQYDPNISVIFRKCVVKECNAKNFKPGLVTYEFDALEEENVKLIEQLDDLLSNPGATENSEVIFYEPSEDPRDFVSSLNGPIFQGIKIFEANDTNWYVTDAFKREVAEIGGLFTFFNRRGGKQSIFNMPIKDGLFNIVNSRLADIEKNIKKLILDNCPLANKDGEYTVDLGTIDGSVELVHSRLGLDKIREAAGASFTNPSDFELMNNYSSAGLIISNNTEYTNGK